MKVFLSSTSEDLEHHRAAACEVVTSLGWQPDMMEHFGTDGRPGIVRHCVEKVEAADVVLLLVAWRRGWVPTSEESGDGERSCTELEVAAAKETRIPILVLMADKDWPGSLYEEEQSARELSPWARLPQRRIPV